MSIQIRFNNRKVNGAGEYFPDGSLRTDLEGGRSLSRAKRVKEVVVGHKGVTLAHFTNGKITHKSKALDGLLESSKARKKRKASSISFGLDLRGGL